MSELSLQVNQQIPFERPFLYYSFPEAANKMEISPRAFRYLLHEHKNEIGEYITKAIVNGRKRKVIKEAGMIILKNDKDRFRGNQFIEKEAKLPILTAKKKIAERAIQVSNQSKTQVKSDIQVLLQVVQAMADNEKKQNERFDNLEKKFDQATQILTTPIETTAAQRKFLNDRVKGYVKQMEDTYSTKILYSYVWDQLHKHVGVHGIANFKFPHYIAAQKYLEQMFNDAGLLW